VLHGLISFISSMLRKSPSRLRCAAYAAFPERWPKEYSQMIEVERLRKLIRFLEVDCVFDIGANEGQYAMMLREIVGYKGRIVSFEPTPHLASKLREVSASDALWEVEEIAISDYSGFADFNLMVSSQMSSLSSPINEETKLLSHLNEIREVIKVKTETLESASLRIFDNHNVCRPFLKLDTQGYDMIIVRSAERILRKFAGVQTEMSIKRLYESSETIGRCIEFYDEIGFDLSALIPNNEGHFPWLLEMDGLFVRRDLVPMIAR